MVELTAELLKQMMPRAPEIFVAPLNEAMNRFGITTSRRQIMFLANLAHESGEFRYMEEIADGTAYEDRADLGNNLSEAKAYAPGGKAGPWFKGHGPLQVTGYLNHKRYSLLLYGDETVLLKNPRLLCQPFDGCLAAAAFIATERSPVLGKTCNELADDDNFLAYCQVINMGPRSHGTPRLPNGWDDRNKYRSRIAAVMEKR